jgi:hypothetical protein
MYNLIIGFAVHIFYNNILMFIVRVSTNYIQMFVRIRSNCIDIILK